MHKMIEDYRERGFIPAVLFEGAEDATVEHPNQIRVKFTPRERFIYADPVSECLDEAVVSLNQAYDRLVTVPGEENYIPPIAPFTMMSELGDSESRLANFVNMSFQGLIADIWTQLLCDGVDRDEKTARRPIHLMWDKQIPKVNALTSLAWLLTCETWPLPRMAPIFEGSYFPPAAHVIPASTARSVATRHMSAIHYGGKPHVNPIGSHWVPLSDALASHMTRLDRERMPKYSASTVVQPSHRPQPIEHSILRRIGEGKPVHNSSWRVMGGWGPSLFFQIGGYAYSQLPDSHFSEYGVSQLRAAIFKTGGVITYPGIPTGEQNLYEVPGGWIRNWSEYGLMVRPRVHESKMLPWTSDDLAMKIENRKFSYVPRGTPPIWFGWTHFGPKYDESTSGEPEMKVTPSQEWVESYQRHRQLAISMLFNNGALNLPALIEEHTIERTERLKEAGRLKGGKNSGEDARASMIAMIEASAAKFKLFG